MALTRARRPGCDPSRHWGTQPAGSAPNNGRTPVREGGRCRRPTVAPNIVRQSQRSGGAVVLGEIIGPDILIVIAVVVVLFGGSQIPKLARSLGSAKKEFERGLHDQHDDESSP